MLSTSEAFKSFKCSLSVSPHLVTKTVFTKTQFILGQKGDSSREILGVWHIVLHIAISSTMCLDYGEKSLECWHHIAESSGLRQGFFFVKEHKIEIFIYQDDP